LEYVRQTDADRLPIGDSRTAQDAAVPTVERKTGDARRRLGRFTRALYHLIRFDQLLLPYAPYPNPHIRTNAFMVGRDRFLALRVPSFGSKFGVYKFESGRSSLTHQIARQGLKTVVVDRKGNAYEPADWKASSTYWIEDQRNLLAADNRTRDYAEGTPSVRAHLEAYAWEDPRLWSGRRA
jgi:hypothetical protein